MLDAEEALIGILRCYAAEAASPTIGL